MDRRESFWPCSSSSSGGGKNAPQWQNANFGRVNKVILFEIKKALLVIYESQLSLFGDFLPN